MFDITVTTVTNLHLGPRELLTVLAIPFGTWWVWSSRYDLAKVALSLRRRSLPNSRQEAAERLPVPSAAFGPTRTSKGS